MDQQDYFDVALAAIFGYDTDFFEECFPGLIFTVFQSFFHKSAAGQKSGSSLAGVENLLLLCSILHKVLWLAHYLSVSST